MKKETSFDMDKIFTLLWVTLVPLVLATMVLGKLLTAALLAVGIWAYFHKTFKMASIAGAMPPKGKTR